MDSYVLVTGAAGGLGKAICEEYASHGFNVVAVDMNEEALKKVCADIEEKYKVKTLCIPANLTADDSAEKILASCKQAGVKVDVLINNAGMGAGGDYAVSDWNRQKAIVELDVVALMHMTRVFLPEMLSQGGGKIGNIASNAAFMPLAPQPTYGASKAFVVSFSQALYEEYKKRNVSVSVVCPGPIKTNFFKTAGFDLKNLKGMEPSEVAKGVYKAVSKGKAMTSIGGSTKLMSVATRLFPRKMVREMAAKVAASK